MNTDQIIDNGEHMEKKSAGSGQGSALEYRITETSVSIRESETGWLTFGIGGPVAGLFLKDLFDKYNRLQRIEAAAREVLHSSPSAIMRYTEARATLRAALNREPK